MSTVLLITPKMAMVGKKVLEDLGFENVHLSDGQEVFMKMLHAAPNKLRWLECVQDVKGIIET